MFIQYHKTVLWDPALKNVGTIENGLAVSGQKVTTGAPLSKPFRYSPAALIQNVFDSTLWLNRGTSAFPSFSLVDTEVGGVQSVTGLHTDNTDPNNPIVKLSVGSSLSGLGTPLSPLDLALSPYVANVKDYGATGDGVTDDTAAFVNAIATGLPVLVPKGDFLLSSTLILNDGQTIFGYGYESNLKTVTHGSTSSQATTYNMIQVFTNCMVSSLRFTGDGLITYVFPFTSQNGVWVQGDNNKILNCMFLNLRGAGVLAFKNDLSTYYNTKVIGCQFTGCTNGIFTYAGCEFATISSCSFHACDVNINERGANNFYSNCTSEYALHYGIMNFGNGGNSDHSAFVGCLVAHNSIGIQISNVVNCALFSGCNILLNDINVSESVKVAFVACGFSTQNITVTATTAKQTLISSCYSNAATTPNITNSGTSAVITQANNMF